MITLLILLTIVGALWCAYVAVVPRQNRRFIALALLGKARTFVAGCYHALVLPISRAIQGRRSQTAATGLSYCENIAEGTRESGCITKFVDAAVTASFLLAKIGGAADRVAICGAADIPIGVMTDEAAAIGDPMNVQLLGAVRGTVKMVASAAIAQGALLEPAAGGKVVTLAGGAGTHHVVGKALDAAAADGDVIEVIPYYFLRVI